jgi:hypothetical protein
LTARLADTERSPIDPEQGGVDRSEQPTVVLPQTSFYVCF